MIRFLSFSFVADKFYQQKTTIPLGTPGLTLFRGANYDAVSKDDPDPTNTPSNGTGKTRLGQLLEGFIFGKTARGNFKKMVSADFEGTLEFEDLRTKTHWSFSYSKGDWVVQKNGQVLEAISHKSSDVQGFLQQTIGISRDEWSYFVQIDGDSLRTLIKGKPAERRAYLEEFFNIDAYYVQQLDLYKQKVKQVADDIRLVEQDQIRLNEVESSLEKLPGSLWLERQIEFFKEISGILNKKTEVLTSEAETLRHQVKTWMDYHKLLVKYEDFEFLKEEEKQSQEEKQLQELRVKVEQQQKLRLFVARQLTPHKNKKPTNLPVKPDFAEPAPNVVTEKKLLLSQMTDKMSVKQALRELVTKLPEIPENITAESLEAERLALQSQKVEWEHRLSILEKTHGKGECPTCGQDLPSHIKTESPDHARGEIKKIQGKMLRLSELSVTLRDYAKKEQEISFLKNRLDSFPVFGLTLPVVKKEIEDLEAQAAAWTQFRRLSDAHQDWMTRDKELEAEARALGYPVLLEESYEEQVRFLTESVRVRAMALKEAGELKRLIDLVMALPPLKDLEARLKELQEELLPDLKARIEEAAHVRGTYSFQLRQRRDLLQQREDLQERVKPYESLKALSRKLEVAVDFYSPSGFKLYELKQRCKLLVERANYWSQIFFQEPYRWSLSQDLDDLNLFVTPTTLKKEDPYPVALLSAGERNRAARVLLFAQLELIPPSKKTNLLFLDEIEANLDEAGIKAFTDVAIPKLKETFPERSIVIVSHLKGLKNSGHFDHLWLAERRERKTKLTPYPWHHRKFSIGEASV